MFFSISKHQDPRFPNSTVLGDWTVNHDNGWTLTDNILSKGYVYPDLAHGNFCKIISDQGLISIQHDLERSFPLWWNSETKTLTNCLGTGLRLWADDIAQLDVDNLVAGKKDVIGPVDVDPLSYDQARAMIDQRFRSKVQKLSKMDLPLKLFVSGGVDTVCLYSYLKQANLSFDLLDYEYFDYDHFTNSFITQIRREHWAYAQIHHWKQPSLLITGGCGDEYLFRGIQTIALWTAWHGIDIVKLVSDKKGYHVRNLLIPKNRKTFEQTWTNRHNIQKTYPTLEDLARYLIDINLNDHQHWHLGNTLTWTPFKDIEIFKIMLRLDHDSLIDHFIDARMSKSLIDPIHHGLISQSKNFNERENLN